MVYSELTLDRTFAALSDPTRRAILARLAQGDAGIAELAQPFAMSLPAVSKHLQVLQRAGLAAIERDGRVRRCHFVPGPLRSAAEWVEQYRRFWEGTLDELARYLGEPSASPSPHADSSEWRQQPKALRPSSKSDAPSRRPRSGSSRRGPRRSS